MAMESAKMMYLDSAIQFLRGIQKLGKEKIGEMAMVKKQLDILRKDVVGTHNDMLRKRKKGAGVDFRGTLGSEMFAQGGLFME